jgi:hypothetical protein
MFSKLSLIVAVAVAVLAAAAPHERRGQCSAGTQACCNSVQKASSPQAQKALGSLGLQAAADALVGLTCSPISVVNGVGSECATQAVCCNTDAFNGIAAVGCNPIPGASA